MKKASRIWAFVALGLIVGWLSVPFGLRAYLNSKYPDIKFSDVNIAGLDCVRIRNAEVNKKTVQINGYSFLVSGTVNSAVACYRGKTIDIDGGKLNVSVNKSSEKKSDGNAHGITITARHLAIHLIKDNTSADMYNVSVNAKSICADKITAIHSKADATIFGLCVNRTYNSVSATNGNITPKFKFKDRDLGEISFAGLAKATRSQVSVGTIKYEDNIATNVQAEQDGEFAFINVGYFSVSHKRLFSSPLGVRNIHVSDISVKDPLSSKILISIDDKVSVLVDIEKKRISGKDSCKNWLDVVPEELKTGPISQMLVKGSFGFDVQFGPVSLKINSTCSIDGPTPQFITDLGKPFKYTAYHPDGTQFERNAGPGTNDWIPLDFVDNMATALTMTEDPGFWHHRGIIPQALENSLKDDMRLGRFFRGGSTITMQLAKNLWLNRSRTLGRKLQEGILTIALESCLSKEKILELYLNVVEFGPNTYGIGPGCAKFLKKFPGEITISEALYMATRLPAPNRARSYEANKGFIQKLIAIGVASGKISEAELDKELQAQQAKDTEDESEEDDE